MVWPAILLIPSLFPSYPHARMYPPPHMTHGMHESSSSFPVLSPRTHTHKERLACMHPRASTHTHTPTHTHTHSYTRTHTLLHTHTTHKDTQTCCQDPETWCVEPLFFFFLFFFFLCFLRPYVLRFQGSVYTNSKTKIYFLFYFCVLLCVIATYLKMISTISTQNIIIQVYRAISFRDYAESTSVIAQSYLVSRSYVFY
jgi:hypothetical protein